jgi:hypothetical protein
MTNTTIANSLYPLASGVTSSNPFVDQFETRDPTPSDVNFPIQKKWLNTATNDFWELKSFNSFSGVTTANWIKIAGSSFIESLKGNDGIVVPPTGNIINVVGDGTYITTVGNAGTSTLTIETAGGLATIYTCNTGTATPSAGNLNVLGTAGATTTGSGNTITIKTEGTVAWNVISASQTLAINNGYICVGGGALSLALPAVSTLGDTIRVALNGSTSFTITQAAGQQIKVSGSTSTLGVSGSVASTGSGDTIELVCQVANTIWIAPSYNGNLTIT